VYGVRMTDLLAPGTADASVGARVRPPVARRRTPPVAVWAVIGVAQVALAVYCVVSWAASGRMARTHPGADGLSTSATVTMWIMQFLGPTVAVGCVWFCIARPWRRERRMTGDGMLLVACFAMAIPHDFLINFSSPSYTYNSHYFNAGSWLGEVPGVVPANANRMPEALAFVVPAYAWGVFLAVVGGCYVMKAISRRWPTMPYLGILGITLVFFMALDFVVEAGVLIPFDVEAYTGSIHGLTLWSGTSNQFPVYEMLYWGLFWTTCTALRFSRDDRGLTFVERGALDQRWSARRATVTRQLALIGAGSAALTVMFNVPWAITASHNNQFPQHLPSYFLNDICSPDAAAATAEVPPCPNKAASVYRTTP
jgi:hypothetical protein